MPLMKFRDICSLEDMYSDEIKDIILQMLHRKTQDIKKMITGFWLTALNQNDLLFRNQNKILTDFFHICRLAMVILVIEGRR